MIRCGGPLTADEWKAKKAQERAEDAKTERAESDSATQVLPSRARAKTKMAKPGRNAPVADDYTAQERDVLDATRSAWESIKKTFQTWVLIGEGLKLLRAKADALGGRDAFRRLLEANDLGYFASKRGKSTATDLLRIMAMLTEVQAWHNGLDETRRYDWASPRAVIQHAEYPDGTRIFPAKTQHPSPGARPKAAEEVVELRRANADLLAQRDELKTDYAQVKAQYDAAQKTITTLKSGGAAAEPTTLETARAAALTPFALRPVRP